MMRFFNFMRCSLSVALTAFLFLSCGKDKMDVNTGADFAKGVFIVNEGQFGSGTGTITYFNPDTDSLIQDVFRRQNEGRPLGNIAQSMIGVGDKYFIAVNNAAKVVVVNRNDFKLIKEIDNIFLPRYFAHSGSDLFVTAWGADFASGEIVVIDVNALTIKSRIAVGGAPEGLWIKGQKLYAAISTVVTPSDQVAVIDIDELKILKTVLVSDNPKFFTEDASGNIWVLCSGNTDFSNPANNTEGALVKFNNDSPSTAYVLPNGSNYITVNTGKNAAYYALGGQIKSVNLGDGSEQVVYDSNAFIYYLTWDTQKNVFYLSDPGDFQSAGKVTVLNGQGQVQRTIDAGIIPGYIYIAN